MACCWAEDHDFEPWSEIDKHWCKDYKPVYKDEETGKEYCVFHAPKEHKGVSVEEFNKLVFAFLDGFKNKGEMCDLSGTIFPGEIRFSEVNYKKKLPGIRIDHAVFAEDIWFDDVEIFGGISCKSAKFSKGVRFIDISIFGELRIENSIFKETFGLVEVKYCKQISINKCNFYSTSIFHNIKSKWFFVINCTFVGVVDIDEVEVLEKAGWYSACLENDANVRNIRGVPVIFSSCDFNSELKMDYEDEESKLILMNQYVANFSFHSRCIGNIAFDACIWPKNGVLHMERKRNGPYSDKKELEELYRALKQRALKEGDQPMVGVWHYREKINAMKQIPKRLYPVSITFWYWLFSGFGERPRKAFAWLAGFLILPFLFIAVFNWQVFDETIGLGLNYIPFAKSVAKSIPEATGWQRLLMAGSQLLITVQAGLAGFALRNRFRRS